jgi:hypothetical protein
MSLEAYMLLLPIAFMLHELEEIALLPDWFNRHITGNVKFPRFIRQIHMANPKVTFIVLEEFIILSALVVYCVATASVNLFTALLLVYVIHIGGHIVQSLLVGKFMPGLRCGLISVVICIPIFLQMHPWLDYATVLIYTLICAVIMVGNLILCHKYFPETNK